MLGGIRADDLTLRDWLDAGAAMLVEGMSDPLLLSAYDRLFGAEDEQTVDDTFRELAAIGDHHHAEFRKAEDKARAKLGIVRSMPQSALDAAAAEWGYVPPVPAAEGDEG